MHICIFREWHSPSALDIHEHFVTGSPMYSVASLARLEFTFTRLHIYRAAQPSALGTCEHFVFYTPSKETCIHSK